MDVIRRKNIYDLMTSIIDADQFEFDHEKEKITLKLPYTPGMIKYIERIILTLFGNPNVAHHEFGDDPLHAEYKFDSHFIEIDEQTLQVDKYGRLFAHFDDIKYNLKEELRDEIKEEVINNIMNDEEFLKELLYKVMSQQRSVMRELIKDIMITDLGLMQKPMHHTRSPHPGLKLWPRNPPGKPQPPTPPVIQPPPGGTLTPNPQPPGNTPIAPPNPPPIIQPPGGGGIIPNPNPPGGTPINPPGPTPIFP